MKPQQKWSRQKCIIEPVAADRSRKDTQTLKNILSQILSNQGPHYWKTFKEFLAGKIERAVFDDIAGDILGPQNVQIHNMLILSILHNSQQQVPPPSPSSSPLNKDFIPSQLTESTINILANILPPSQAYDKSTAFDSDHLSLLPGGNKRKLAHTQDTNANSAEIKRRLRFREIMTLNKDDRSMLSSIKKQKTPKSNKSSTIPQFNPHSGLDIFESLDPIPQLCTEVGLPTKEMLRSRMRFIAALTGVKGEISDDCVDLMSKALDNHLKNILGSCLNKTKSVETNFLESDSQLEFLNEHAKQQMQRNTSSSPSIPSSVVINTATTNSTPARRKSSLLSKPSPKTRSSLIQNIQSPKLGNSIPSISTLTNGTNMVNGNVSASATNGLNGSKVIARSTSAHKFLSAEDLEFTFGISPRLTGKWNMEEK